MAKSSPHAETPVDIITQQPVLASSSTFQLTWPAGEEPPTHSIPSAPQGVLELTQHTPPIINPFFDPIPMAEVAAHGTLAAAGVETPADAPPALAPRPTPRFSRALSTPLPAQLKHLRHPSRRKLTASPTQLVVTTKSPLPPPPPASDNIAELALELADSVQMVIQTLIQISPPHLLDPAKEQLAGCTLQLPTPSVSALLTTMKNLNYMSANLSSLSSPRKTPELETVTEENIHTIEEIMNADMSELTGDGEEVFTTNPTSLVQDDFDVGEVLQSVGDVLSGMAANLGVDLVIFHADVGMKHVNVRGDECGISYALCHVIRQVIGTAHQGDEVEIGLFISAPNAARLMREDSTASETASPAPTFNSDEPLMCTLEITHNFTPTNEPSEPTSELSAEKAVRPSPHFSAIILRRLLQHVRATLQVDVTPSAPSAAPTARAGRTVEFSVLLSPGPTVSETLPNSEDRQPFNDVMVAREPTLDELASFVAADADDPTGRVGLKGKKAIFHANERSSFAHHLTSYLTAWGMDVSHVPTTEGPEEEESSAEDVESSQHASSTSRSRAGSEALHASPEMDPTVLPAVDSDTPKSEIPAESPKSDTPYGSRSSRGSRFKSAEVQEELSPPTEGPRAWLTELAGTSFIIIDDDIRVLRRRLQQIRKLAEAKLKASIVPYQPKNSRKRPSLHHRPRSSPSIRLPTAISHSSIPGTIEEGLGENEEEDKTADFDPLQVVVVHFTSLSNYKTVQDIIQASFYAEPTVGSPYSIDDIIPELLVIPKPAGPRRFLTALHTAVQKPLIDPFFAPIATTPMSPGIQYRGNGPWGPPGGPFLGRRTSGAGLEGALPGPGSRIPAGRQSSSGSNPSGLASVGLSSSRAPILLTPSGDRRSPREHPVIEQQHRASIPIPAVPSTYTGQGHIYTPHPPSPLAREAVEYFSVDTNDVAQIGDSTGVLLHSPDGRPAGIFFQPQQQPKDSRRTIAQALSGNQGNPDDHSPGPSRPFRAASFNQQPMGLDAAVASVSSPVGTPGGFRFRADSPIVPVGATPSPRIQSSTIANRRSPAVGEDPGRPPINRLGSSRFIVPLAPNNGIPRRKTFSSGASEIFGKGAVPSPTRVLQVDPSLPVTRSHFSESPKASSPSGASPGGAKKTAMSRRSSAEAREKAALMSPLKKVKGMSDGTIMPPINVLIVEDNHINQTILSTFMKRKKINYGTAKNGQEAVDQWRSGNYHLILMDIQMPVKDGIEATKEIRQLERERNMGISPSTPPSELAETAKASGVPHSPYRSSVIIVALTASSLKSDRVSALAAGCNDFLTKPVSMTWLNTKIIEWGSIKVLEMFQDPATVRLFAGQTAKSKVIASQLKLPPSRNASPTPPILEQLPDPSPIHPGLKVQAPSTPELPLLKQLHEAPVLVNHQPSPSQLTSSHSSSNSAEIKELSGDDALKQHVEVVKNMESLDGARPIVLGEGALSSEGSSTSIANVLHGVPPIAEDAASDTPSTTPSKDSLIQTPAIPPSSPSGPPEESDNENLPAPPGAYP